jgi:hypothetical protein
MVIEEISSGDKMRLIARFQAEMLCNRNVHVSTSWLDTVLRSFNAYSETCSINCNHIYQKWINSDLNKMAYDFAPYPGATCAMGTLQKVQGPMIMQVMSVKDVAHPDVHEEDEDAMVDAEREQEGAEATQMSTQQTQSNRSTAPSSTANRFKKASRYLSLELFDGYCSHRAFEYQLWPTISLEQLTPGSKVLLKGTIQIASGVFLLKHDNLEVLGGKA